jgi:hypothetical protein
MLTYTIQEREFGSDRCDVESRDVSLPAKSPSLRKRIGTLMAILRRALCKPPMK